MITTGTRMVPEPGQESGDRPDCSVAASAYEFLAREVAWKERRAPSSSQTDTIVGYATAAINNCMTYALEGAPAAEFAADPTPPGEEELLPPRLNPVEVGALGSAVATTLMMSYGEASRWDEPRAWATAVALSGFATFAGLGVSAAARRARGASSHTAVRTNWGSQGRSTLAGLSFISTVTFIAVGLVAWLAGDANATAGPQERWLFPAITLTLLSLTALAGFGGRCRGLLRGLYREWSLAPERRRAAKRRQDRWDLSIRMPRTEAVIGEVAARFEAILADFAALAGAKGNQAYWVAEMRRGHGEIRLAAKLAIERMNDMVGQE